MSYGMPFRVYLILQLVLQIRPQGMSYGMPFRVYLILQPVLQIKAYITGYLNRGKT